MVLAIIFDMDGLMFDTERLALESYKKAGKMYGYSIDFNVISKAIGRNTKDTKLIMIEQYGDEFPFDNIRRCRLKYTRDEISNNGVPIKKGLLELLEYCKRRGIYLAVATSTDRKHAEELLKSAKVIDYFDIIICGDDIVRGKPEPDIFLKASEKLSIKPSECIVLEDSENGIKAAFAANMIPIFVPDLIKQTDTIKIYSKFTCESLFHVISKLEELM